MIHSGRHRTGVFFLPSGILRLHLVERFAAGCREAFADDADNAVREVLTGAGPTRRQCLGDWANLTRSKTSRAPQ
jgi:hypothetical protein